MSNSLPLAFAVVKDPEEPAYLVFKSLEDVNFREALLIFPLPRANLEIVEMSNSASNEEADEEFQCAERTCERCFWPQQPFCPDCQSFYKKIHGGKMK